LEESIDGVSFSVYDWDFGTKDDFLGTAFIPFSSLELGGTVSKTLSLLPRENHPQDNYVKGDLMVKVFYARISSADKDQWKKDYLGGQSSKLQHENSRECLPSPPPL